MMKASCAWVNFTILSEWKRMKKEEEKKKKKKKKNRGEKVGCEDGEEDGSW
jgi:hypothetical protein